MLNDYLPSTVNSGPWVPAWTLNRLAELPDDAEFVLPICSLSTPFGECVEAGAMVLPPLYHEALDASLQQRIVDQILTCFPRYADRDGNKQRVRVVELPRVPMPKRDAPKVVAFSVDTAVEEHGPHLPLGTDTIQSYSVLRQLQTEVDGFEMFRPIEYGQLTWGLPFGFSIDLTTSLLTEYVTNYANAVGRWLQPQAIYVVDVHGSITHRQAIVDGLQQSNVERWAFRWLHEPLAEFASERGDQHAGGVETALVKLVSDELIDAAWFPSRIDQIAAGQMTFQQAVNLTPNLGGFVDAVREKEFNGVIGDIHNYSSLDASLMFERMLSLARQDVVRLMAGDQPDSQDAGAELW